MTSKLTRERIELIANFHRVMALPTSHAEIEELARMALAAMDSEPVAEVLSNRPGNDTSTIDRALPIGTQLYRHAQPAPECEQLAIENFRSAMEGIGHIRRTLEETFGGLHGTHVEPDVLAECKAICDAIYAAYSGNSPVIPDGWTGNDKANAALVMLDRIETVDPVDDDRIDGIKRIVRELAAAQQEVNHG
ncbi:hypothetical protein R1Q26_07235 [Klebsiella quasipneumoniae]|uniref:hypothetical protein n=1 Tax=Klebsiella quasipneumoniae TaxID=1463165 RepID=UPI00292C6BDD|nr:hypothetical protein [Klebsiella quasipneumoniae]WPA29488.1 hypothetical protein R1Q26_07235 [Klebsiella quasipneumoniae]